MPFTEWISTPQGEARVGAFGVPLLEPVRWDHVAIRNLDVTRVLAWNQVDASYSAYAGSDLESLVLQPGDGYYLETRLPGSITFSG